MMRTRPLHRFHARQGIGAGILYGTTRSKPPSCARVTGLRQASASCRAILGRGESGGKAWLAFSVGEGEAVQWVRIAVFGVEQLSSPIGFGRRQGLCRGQAEA